MTPIVNPEAAQKAVKGLVKAIGVPEGNISRLEINCNGTVKVFTRDRAYYTVAHVDQFKREER